MTHPSFKNTVKLVFLPALFISIFLLASSTLFSFIRTVLVVKALPPMQVVSLKTLVIFPQIILVLTLLIVSKYKPFEKVFKVTLGILAGVMAFLTALLLYQNYFQIQGVTGEFKISSEPVLQIYKLHIVHWPRTLFYIVSNLLSFNLFFVFVWGFINRFMKASEAVKYYLPLAFTFGLLETIATHLKKSLTGNSSGLIIFIAIVAIILIACALMIFNHAWKRILQTEMDVSEISSNVKIRFPYLSAAYLLVGCIMVNQFLSLIFKSQLKNQYPLVADYRMIMGNYLSTIKIVTLIISVLWVVIGTWLLLKKGWRKTALYASISVFLGGIILLCLFAYKSFILGWGQGFYSGLLIGTTSSLFFPLIQVLYLYLPQQKRFSAKVATEMFIMPLMGLTPSFIMQALVVVFMTISATTIYLKILALILLALLILASIGASSKFLNKRSLIKH